MFDLGWNINLDHPYYEYFISNDGWCISFTDSRFCITKYLLSLSTKFKKVRESEIKSLNEDLISQLFMKGWFDNGDDNKLELL